MAELLQLLILAVVVGGVLYIFQMLPIDATIKKVATVLVLIVAIVYAIKWLMHFAH